MESYDRIFERAANRHGGEDALREKIDQSNAHPAIKMSDAQWLGEFTKRIFQSGFNWKVVEAKWDGFETAFWGFNPHKCSEIDMEDMERLTTDTQIIRNGMKIKTVAVNAQMILNMKQTAGSADKFIRGWPSTDYIGLLDHLHKNGSRLGANTASYALRFSGVPSFIFSNDVLAALRHAGIIDKAATSKRAKKAVQDAFNIWAQESGLDISANSRTLALSIDAG